MLALAGVQVAGMCSRRLVVPKTIDGKWTPEAILKPAQGHPKASTTPPPPRHPCAGIRTAGYGVPPTVTSWSSIASYALTARHP